MKKLIMRNFKNHAFIKLTAVTALILSMNVSSAQSSTLEPIVKNATVNHVPTGDNQVAFRVQLENDMGEKFSVSIKDETGSLLFHEVYQDKKFDKKFLLTKADHRQFSFIVRSLKDHQTQSFKVSTTSRYVEDYTVSIKK